MTPVADLEPLWSLSLQAEAQLPNLVNVGAGTVNDLAKSRFEGVVDAGDFGRVSSGCGGCGGRILGYDKALIKEEDSALRETEIDGFLGSGAA